jgi:two-component system heavy metal sensor histidine kinase CusS
VRSLRSRLLLGTGIASTVILLAAGVILYLLVRMALVEEFNAVLAAKARALAALVEQDGDKVDFEAENVGMPEFEKADRPEYFELWLDDSAVLARSKSLRGGDLSRIGGTPGVPVFNKTRLPDGRHGRLVGITFAPRRENNEGEPGRPARPREVTLVVARDTAGIDRTLAQLEFFLTGVWAAAVLVTLGVLAFVVRRGLRPANRLAAQIGRVGEADLGTRIELANAPAELMPVVQRLNDLFARLEAAFSREKAFSADIAHELRTPLAGLRATLEISLSNPREAAKYREAMVDCLSITRQMQAMVENLLSLARAEAGQIKIDRRSVDVAEMLDDCWKAVAERAEARGLDVQWGVERPCTLSTDAEKLRQVIYSLLDNAVAYADESGRVWIDATARVGGVTLRIGNTGSRLTSEQVPHVFERFWRGDAARTDVGLRCGLGLSLAQKMVTLLGGRISAESNARGEFVVTLEFDDVVGYPH